MKSVWELAWELGPSPLNVLRYVPVRVMASIMTALFVTWILYPRFIRMLQARQIGQTIREDGPQSHQSKGGTPTMGGTLIMIAVLVSTLLWGDLGNAYVVVTLLVTLALAVVGLVDDMLKLYRGKARGLRGRTKLAWQFAIAVVAMVVFFYLLAPVVGYNTRLYFPFFRSDRFFLEIPVWLYASFAAVVIVGTSNAVNLTDGLDGLAILPAITASSVYLVFAYVSGATLAGFTLSKYLLIPNLPGLSELAVIAAALIGAGIGFLWFNSYPASIFMGDVGSLSLGGALGCFAVFTKNELLSIVVGGIFFLEAVSVIVQTASYKLTGKRVFRMAPIHHHFELKGYPEPKIITRFWIISILLGIFALMSIKVR